MKLLERLRAPRIALLAAVVGLVLILDVAVVTTNAIYPPTEVLGETFRGSGSSSLQTNSASCSGDFCIAGAVSDLYPALNSTLVLTVTNKKPVPIVVQSITITKADANSSCVAANLSTANFSGNLPVAALGTATQSVPIGLAANAPNACQGSTWALTYAGTAGYNQGTTSTSLAVSPNPGLVGLPVTLAASLTAPAPSSGVPTGTMSFFDGTTLIGTVPVDSSGHAQVATSSLASGSHSLKAVYNGDTNFLTSSSAVVTENVGYSGPCITGNQGGPLIVSTGQSVCLTGKVNGNAPVRSGAVLSVNGGTVNGTVTVQPGGRLIVAAGSSIGDVTATSPAGVQICGAKKVNGSIAVTGSSGVVVIGDLGNCGSNDINGGVTLSSNAAGISLSGNRINDNVSVTGTTGGPSTIAGNTRINGNLACSGNSPAPTNAGRPNTVKGARSGQCGAPGF